MPKATAVTAGPVASMVSKPLPVAPVRPEVSVARAVRVCVPLARVWLLVTDQRPSLSAKPVPSEVLPENTSTVAPASAKPVMVGVVSWVVSAWMKGASGALVSITRLPTAE